jgi:hypothetical protein
MEPFANRFTYYVDRRAQFADSDEENRSFRAEDDQKFAKRRW